MITVKTILQVSALWLLLFSGIASARYEKIEWHNQDGQIFIEKASYPGATFNTPMCSMQGLRECRLFFISYSAGFPVACNGITIASATKLTDTQYVAELAKFSGQLLALPADGGLCIWLYQRGSGSNYSMDRYNCEMNGGIPPTEPVIPKCSAIGGPVEIDYGDIQANDAPGMKLTEYLSMMCDADATVKVSISGYTDASGLKLRTDGSLTADISVRDKPGNTGSVELMNANQIVNVPISSLLKVNGELAGGAFRGSAVIHMDIQ